MTSPTTLQIGCITLTIEQWREKRVILGEKEHYTPEQLEEYRLYIELAATLYPPKPETGHGGTTPE